MAEDHALTGRGRARHAGLVIPLFSAPSSSSWGIGELPDIAPLAAWMARGGFDRLMLLPLGTMASGQASPYTASSALAIDPIYIAVEQVDEFRCAGGMSRLSTEGRRALEAARSSSRVRHDEVRRAKAEALDLAFKHFVGHEWVLLTLRASSLARYIARERWWLDDYALFQAISHSMRDKSWREWPEGLRDRQPSAIDEARRQLWREILEQQYLQWIAETQWQQAREVASGHGVSLVGDLPFMVNAHSADVWTRPQDFRLDVSVGAPPDAFSDTGQDWGVPMYDWAAIAAGDFQWLRQRARRMAALYGGFRVDHLVGFYRTFGRAASGEHFFNPADEGAQLAQGERVLQILRESGAEILAEDLGTVPDFVRASLARLAVPGLKVMRWERAWHAPGQPFIDPRDYPDVSVTATGTHDTETLSYWWEHGPRDERALFLALPALRDRIGADPDRPWSAEVADALLALAYGSRSDDLFMPVQDMFGWRDRINEPATVGDANWTWRLPWPVDHLGREPEAEARTTVCRSLARDSGRGVVHPGPDGLH